jgi:hypothetical protein
LHPAFDALTAGIGDPVAMKLHVDQIAVFQVSDLIGDIRERDRVGGEEVFASTDTDYERHAMTHADQTVRLVAANDGKGIS